MQKEQKSNRKKCCIELIVTYILNFLIYRTQDKRKRLLNWSKSGKLKRKRAQLRALSRASSFSAAHKTKYILKPTMLMLDNFKLIWIVWVLTTRITLKKKRNKLKNKPKTRESNKRWKLNSNYNLNKALNSYLIVTNTALEMVTPKVCQSCKKVSTKRLKKVSTKLDLNITPVNQQPCHRSITLPCIQLTKLPWTLTELTRKLKINRKRSSLTQKTLSKLRTASAV